MALKPLKIGDVYHYTLSSWEPVEVEVQVPYVCEQDRINSANMVLADYHTSLDEIDDAWVAEHLEGFSTKEELMDTIASELKELNDTFVTDQMRNRCLDALTERLEQDLPEEELGYMRQALELDLERTLEEDKMTREEFSKMLTGSPDMIDVVLNDQARLIVSQAAALSAYAAHFEMSVEDSELPGLMGMPPEDAQKLIEDAIAAGAIEQVRHNALRAKAAADLFDKAKVTYAHESLENATKRAQAQAQQLPHHACCHHDHDESCGCHNHCGCEH